MRRPFILILDFMGVMKRMAGSGRRSFTGNFGGVQGRFDINLTVDNKEFVAMCDRLKYSNMAKDADIRKAFAKVAKPVKQTVQQAARSSMRTDRRKASKAVRIITLKKGKGVVVGLLNPRKAGNAMAVPPRPTGGKSGIRRHRRRSERTNQVDGYRGADRAWLLRIINQGTVNGPRKAGTRGTLKKLANRGDLSAKRFFDRAEAAMQQASKSLAAELGKIIDKKQK
jgi:hypothetical protein